MTSPRKSALVLDGSEVKLRLQAHRTHSKTPVHVDWLRFTCLLRHAPTPAANILFPDNRISVWDEKQRGAALTRAIDEVVSVYELGDGKVVDLGSSTLRLAAMQALELARLTAECLGTDYAVEDTIKKGHDFYKHRWPILRNGTECGWVGFGASSESPKQKSQARTIHVNLFGAACTFAKPGWNHRLANLIDAHEGDVTRADLALDFFDGLPGGMDGIKADYLAGLCDSNGRRLKCNMVGDWANGHARSFYFGSKEAGKQTNIYEKGDQLFGIEACSPWHRIELRYGNKLRELPSDILRRPADFFAGASDWHTAMLAKANHLATPQQVNTTPRLALQTVEAEVNRNVRWAHKTAAATISACFEYMGDSFIDLLSPGKLPGRLSKFSKTELAAAFSKVTQTFTAGGAGHVAAYA